MRHLFIAMIMGGIAALALHSAGASAHQDRPTTLRKVVRVDIPAQKVSTALIALSQQAAVQVLMPGKLVDGAVSSAVSGEMTLEEAISKLLTGTNLHFREVGENAIGIDAKQPDG